jgi:cell division protein FtsB
MFDFQEKRKIRRILYSKVSISIVLLLAMFMGMSALERYTTERETARKLNEREAVLDSLNLRAEALGAKVERLKNDRGLEEEIRNRFDVVKEGEQVVIFIGEDQEEKPRTATSTSIEEQSSGPWLKMFKFW